MDCLGAGFDRQPDFQRRRSTSTSSTPDVVIRGGPQIHQQQPHAVDAHFELFVFGGLPVLRPEIDLQQGEFEEVFAIDRKVVPDHDATPRSERQTLNVLVLRNVASDFVSHGERLNAGVAHGQTADLGRCADITLDQCR